MGREEAGSTDCGNDGLDSSMAARIFAGPIIDSAR